MEEKELTPGEGIDLITMMITSTKRHLTKGEGNMLLFWGYLCVGVGILALLLGYLKFGVRVDIPLWLIQATAWLVPLIGIPYTIYVMRRKRVRRKVLTYSDRLTTSLWNYVLWLALAAFLTGLVFFTSSVKAWYIMELYAFFVIGMAVTFQGIIIRECSLVSGGAFSVICGGFLTTGLICDVDWINMVSLPLFIIDFIVMMIIPGHILNHKAAKEDERA
ncbi:MAG: hypothetical protein DBY35_13465 [Bacteroidales bacterium]|nr:MAG: hypothetical protein DBY35_13465 [Bacteroidales bacterium]